MNPKTTQELLQVEIDKLKQRVVELEARLADCNQEKKDQTDNDVLFRTLVEQVDSAVVIIQENKIVYANPFVEKALGYTVEEVVNTFFLDYIDPEEREATLIIHKKRMNGAPLPQKYERILRHKNGTKIIAEISGKVIPYNGKPANMVTLNDVTARKQTEQLLIENESILNQAQEVALMGSYVWNLRDDSLVWSENMYKIAGIHKEDFTGTLKEVIQKIIHPEDMERIAAEIAEMVEEKETKPIVFRIIRPDGAERILRSSSRFQYDEHGNPEKCIGVHYDITEQQQKEIKMREQASMLHTLVNAPIDTLALMEQSGTLLAINKKGAERMHATPEQLVGKNIYKLFPKEVALSREDYVNQVFETGKAVSFEDERDGSYLLNTIYPVFDEKRNVKHAAVFATEITQQKQMEIALRTSEEKYKFLAENTADVIWIVDLNFKVTYVSPAIEKVLGFTPEERMKQSLEEMMAPESLQTVVARYEEELQREEKSVVAEDRLITIEIEYYHKDGSTVWMENSVRPLRDKSGAFIGIAGASRDIRERKQAEKILKESERKYRTLVERSIQGVVIALANPVRLGFASSPMERISGYSPEELMAFDADKISQLIHPADREEFFANFRKRLEDENIPAHAQYRILHKNGETRWVEIYSSVIEFQGHPATQTVFLDITERKRAEDEFRKSEEKYRRIVDTANEGIWMMDKNYCTTYVNEKMAVILGYTLDEMIGKSIKPYIFPDDLPDQVKVLQRREQGEDAQYERRFLHKDGSVRWLFVSATALKDERGNFAGSFAMFTDITDRKKAEDELRDKKIELEEILRALPDALIYADVNRRIVKVNQAFEKIFGYRPEEVLGQKTKIIYVDSEEFKDQGKIRYNVNARGLYTPYEINYKRKDGRIFPSETVGTPVFGADGKPLGFIGLVREITERKIAEKKLRDQANELQWLFKSMINAFVIFESVFDEQGKFISYRFIYINDAYERVTGVKNDEVTGKTVHEVWPDTEQSWIENYGEVAVTGISKTFDMYHSPTKKLYHCNVYRPWDSADRFCVIFEDITEKEKAAQKLQESEERYRVLFETLEDAIFVADPESGNLLDMNLQAEKLTGYTRDEMIGKHQSFLHPENQEQTSRKLFHQATQERGSRFNEIEVITKAGKHVPVEVSSGGIVSIGGKSVHIGVFRNITERKEAEQELRQSEQRFRSLYQNATVGLYRTTPDGKIIMANPTIVKMLGFNSLEELKKRNLSQDGFAPQYSRESFIRQIEKSREIIGLESAWTTKFGNKIYVRESCRAIRDENGKTIYYEGTVEDISERRKAEIALVQSENKFRDLFNEAPVGYHVIDADGRIRQINKTELEMLGYESDEMVGNFICNFFADKNCRINIENKLKGQLETGRSYERLFVRKDGSTLNVLVEDRLLEDSNGKIIGMRETIQDISELKKMQHELQSHLEFFEILIDTMPNPVFYKDAEGRYQGGNQAFASEILGKKKEDIIGKTVADLTDAIPHELAAIYHRKDMELIKNPGKQFYEAKVRCADGTQRDFIFNKATYNDLRGEVAGMICVMVDISQQKKLEQELRHSMKMEAIGRLAGGIAHDFNNLLTAILGNAEFAMYRLSQNNPMREDLNEILKAGNRAATLTQQLLAYSRKQPLKRKVTNLNHVVMNIKKMLQRIIGEDIDLVTELAANMGSCYVDPSQVEQVIMNLAVNARDAMPDGGKMLIRTENVEIENSDSKSSENGKAVCLVVQDSGSGIDSETLERIFDPFFTTKGQGGGTGLGLSVVHGIVEQHEGWLKVDSEIGDGTTFRVFFPGISDKVEVEEVDAIPIKPFQGNKERILLVEDEKDVRNFISKILTYHNYTVFSEENAAKALSTFDKEDGQFDLLLSDVVLPDKSGHDLAKQLMKKKPGLRILLSSGYMDEKVEWEGIQAHEIPFLQKPYDLRELLEAIKKALSSD